MQKPIENRELEATLTAALERAPEPVIPTGFAARVATRAAAMPARVPRRRLQYGPTVAIAAAVLLTIALFVLAPHASPSQHSFGFLAEMLVLAQLAGLAYWLTRMQREHF